MYTRGNVENNFTLGAGFWYSEIGKNEEEIIEPTMDPSFIAYNKKITTSSPAFNFSTQLKLSEYVYFLSENYWFKLNMDGSADMSDGGFDFDIGF